MVLNTMEQPQTVDEVKDKLECTKNGIAQKYRNCLIALQQDPLLRGAIRYNQLTARVDIVKPVGWKRSGVSLTDTDINYLLVYLEEHYGLASEKKITKAVSIVANENRYHPIQDYLNSLQWDGEKRIPYVLNHFFGSGVNAYTHEAMQIFLLGAISRAFKPGSKFEVMLCLAGGQGAGKSTFFRFLAIKDEWFSDDLRKIDDDNVYRKLQGHWIIEMSEMIATASAKSIEEIKSFISRQKENYKIPYETHPEDRPRQCVFGGTSNNVNFLPLDRTGNRRFIPILVMTEQAEVHILDDEKASREYLLQVWAEAMEIYRTGKYSLKFSPAMEQHLKEHQKEFMPDDTNAGLIEEFLENFKGDYVCSKLLYKEALNHPYNEPEPRETKYICDIMNNSIEGWVSFSSARRFPGYGTQKGWKRVNQTPPDGDGFLEVTEQMEIPFK